MLLVNSYWPMILLNIRPLLWCVFKIRSCALSILYLKYRRHNSLRNPFVSCLDPWICCVLLPILVRAFEYVILARVTRSLDFQKYAMDDPLWPVVTLYLVKKRPATQN